MNTNVYSIVNNARNSNDRSKIRTLGAFAYALEEAMKEEESKHPFEGKYMETYKGAKMSQGEVDAYKCMVN